MDYTLGEHTAKITCTWAEIDWMHHFDGAVYATPVQDTVLANQLYLGSRPQWRYDFIIATVDDFCDALGINLWTLSEEDADIEDETITVVVPRSRRAEPVDMPLPGRYCGVCSSAGLETPATRVEQGKAYCESCWSEVRFYDDQGGIDATIAS